MNESKKAIIIAVLGFLTFGIANIIYIYLFSIKIARDSNGKTIYPLRELILDIITFGIYGIIWTYKISKTLDKHEGYAVLTSPSLICTIISGVFLRSISMAYIYYRLKLLEAPSEYQE